MPHHVRNPAADATSPARKARRAVLIDPDNMSMRYNLACDHVITLSDPDFDPIRSDERFQAMIADAERRLAAARNT